MKYTIRQERDFMWYDVRTFYDDGITDASEAIARQYSERPWDIPHRRRHCLAERDSKGREKIIGGDIMLDENGNIIDANKPVVE